MCRFRLTNRVIHLGFYALLISIFIGCRPATGSSTSPSFPVEESIVIQESQNEIIVVTQEINTVNPTPPSSPTVFSTASSIPSSTSIAIVSEEIETATPIAGFQVNRVFSFGGERRYDAWGERIVVSPDGAWVAVITVKEDDGLKWEEVILYNYKTGEQRILQKTDATTGTYLVMNFSPDSKSLAIAGTEQIIWVWDVSTGNLSTQLSFWGPISDLAFSHDGQLIAVVSPSEDPQEHGIGVFDLETEALIAQTKDSVALSVAFLENEGQLVIGAEYYSEQFKGSTLFIWDYEIDKVENILSQYSGTRLVTINDEKNLVVAVTENILHLIEIPSLREIELEKPEFVARTIRFDAMDNVWALAFDGTLSQWDSEGKLIQQTQFPEATDFAVIPETNHLLISFPEETWEVVFP